MDDKEPPRRANDRGHGTDDQDQEVAKMHDESNRAPAEDVFTLGARAFEKHAAKLEETDPEKAAQFRRKAARWREGLI